MDLDSVRHVVTLAAAGLGGYLVSVAKVGIETRVKSRIEGSVKEAVKAEHWPQELARELEQARGAERQERRFKNYGLLWHELRPLAVYDKRSFDKPAAELLSKSLSDWYFSADGGLMLTAPLREFYFTLQDLLSTVSATDVPAWQASRVAEPEKVFLALADKLAGAKEAITYLDGKDGERPVAAWPLHAMDVARSWRAAIAELGKRWSMLAPTERFVVLQQTGSVLRTAMTTDVDSRLR